MEETWKVNQYELARGRNSGEGRSVLTPKGNEKHKRPAMQCDTVQAGADSRAAPAARGAHICNKTIPKGKAVGRKRQGQLCFVEARL